MRQIICVGACYVDTILTVPHYPGEDDKLRATNLSKRRGGNCPNTLEVLHQLIEKAEELAHENERDQEPVSLSLLAVLPNANSTATQFIKSSLPSVDIEHCIYREECDEAASSYIVRSEQSGSRTIVNYNDLAEMTVAEFIKVADHFLSLPFSQGTGVGEWWHFEGRVPDITLQCMQYLSRHHPDAKMSVEVEKPNRDGLEKLAGLANVVFYSKSWASARGYTDSVTFLEELGPQARDLQFCTWGADGAAHLLRPPGTPPSQKDGSDYQHTSIHGSQSWLTSKVIDTIGAGDTFIAGILFAYAATPTFSWWYTYSSEAMDFAIELAGRKVTQEGFQGLGEAMQVDDQIEHLLRNCKLSTS